MRYQTIRLDLDYHLVDNKKVILLEKQSLQFQENIQQNTQLLLAEQKTLETIRQKLYKQLLEQLKKTV